MEKVPDDHTGEVDVGVMGNLGPIALRHWVSPVLPRSSISVYHPYSTSTGDRVVGQRVTLERKSTYSALLIKSECTVCRSPPAGKKDIIPPGRLK